MQLHARLVHAEPGRRVVEVSAQRNGEVLGSTLGEGTTAEEAEDRALARLQARLGGGSSSGPKPVAPPERITPKPIEAKPLATPPPAPVAAPPVIAKPEAPAAAQSQLALDSPAPSLELPALPRAASAPVDAPQEPAPDPEDWSSELAQIDLQLRRLGWQREQESAYLERAFGHPSRGRLTTYGDLLAYLQALQALEPGSDPNQAAVPLLRRDLLAQCDGLLAQLQWDASQGRQFLERQFQVSSRQQLSDSQLLQFNMLLEGELIGV